MNRVAIDKAIVALMIEHGPDGHCDGHERITDYVVSLVEPLVALLQESRREHVNEYDGGRGFYCGWFMITTATGERGACTCGADEWNAKIDNLTGEMT